MPKVEIKKRIITTPRNLPDPDRTFDNPDEDDKIYDTPITKRWVKRKFLSAIIATIVGGVVSLLLNVIWGITSAVVIGGAVASPLFEMIIGKGRGD